MHPTPLRDGSLAVGATRYDLEEFWPSRRSHAYDEFCRWSDGRPSTPSASEWRRPPSPGLPPRP